MADDLLVKARNARRDLNGELARDQREANEVRQKADDLKRAMKKAADRARAGVVVRSKKPKRLRRWSMQQDAKTFRSIKAALADDDRVVLTSRSGDLVTDMRSDGKRIRTDIEESKATFKGQKQTTFYVPIWDHSGDYMKALAFGQVVYEAQGMAMSVNLGDEVINAAMKSSKSFAAHMRDRITSYLRTAMTELGQPVPDYFFMVESGYGGQPHLHGAIVIHDEPEIRAAVLEALRKAGGDWKPRAKQVQVDLQPLVTPAKWIGYISKWSALSKGRLGDASIVAASNGLRAKAKAWYQAARRSGVPIAN
ncbi:hypothetical protein [Caulobacter endophyticus]|uniref:hypothetical protein n=1 Tax=Caulobacter endophyticus TaxID=2172652 RepID=UPI00240F4238|nr:hypothetical protein [Caulobacter endophyticus]MDG2531021.1 hypothetical protein [Caulobacter endophyticus]